MANENHNWVARCIYEEWRKAFEGDGAVPGWLREINRYSPGFWEGQVGPSNHYKGLVIAQETMVPIFFQKLIPKTITVSQTFSSRLLTLAHACSRLLTLSHG